MISLRTRLGLTLVVAWLAISSGAVLVVSITDAQPIAIAFWRTTLVALLLAATMRPLPWKSTGQIALAGACLAGHFVAWFASLEHTTVLRSTVLVSVGPMWTGLLEWGVLGQAPQRRFWGGIALALLGVALMATESSDNATLWGDALALLGGVLGALYFVLGRTVRRTVGIGTYACLVCAAAAVLLFGAATATGTPLLGFSYPTWGLLAALALGPQLLGHNGLNFALRHLSAATVTAVTLLEPVGAALLAALILGQLPSLNAVVGGAIVVAGVLTASMVRR